MGNVMGKFIQPLSKIFPLPKSALGHEDAFFEAYFEVLKTFDDITLAEAVRQIQSTRTQRSFPLPAECNLACAEVINLDAIRARQEAKPGNRHEQREFNVRYPEWSERHIKRTDELFAACAFSKAAVAEHWSWQLWTWIQQHSRAPDVHEARSIKSAGVVKSKEIEDIVEKCEGNRVVAPLHKMLSETYGRLQELTQHD